ncbi:hypothetical protein [Nocardia australiensis]|nr:hypothetical protein [Nocardia australiensis]
MRRGGAHRTGDVAELPAPELLESLASLDEYAWARVHYADAVVHKNVLS